MNQNKMLTMPQAKIVYGRRKELSEQAFGILKEHMGFRRFLLREMDIIKATTFMIAAACSLHSLYRVWIGNGMTWKTGSAKIITFIS
jgi:hypothetical protein